MSAIHQGSWLKKIFQTGKWYLLSSLFTKGLGFLLLPIYTRYLSPSEYGVLNTLNSLAQFFPIVMSLYLDAAFGRFFHEMKHSPEKLSGLFSTVFWFVSIWGMLVTAVLLLTGFLWTGAFLPDVPYVYFILAILPCLCIQLGQLGMIFLRQSLDSKRTTLIEISGSLILVVITLPLLIWFQWGVMARLVGALVPALLIFTYYVSFFRKKGLLKIFLDFSLLRNCLWYSIPLIPNVAGGWISSLSDRLVLAKYADLNAVGLYSLAFNLGQILYLIQDAITQVTGAVSMSGLVDDKENTKKKMADLSLNLWALMLLANLGLTLFSPELVQVVASNKYSDATLMIGIVAFSYVLSSQYRIFTDIISFHKKTWVITTAGLLMAAASLGLNLLLVPRFGYEATAWTFVASTLVYTFWIFVWAQKWDPLPLRLGATVLLFAVFVALQFVNYWMAPKVWDFTSLGLRLLMFCFDLIFVFLLVQLNRRRVKINEST